MNELIAQDYSEGCAAGRSAAEVIINGIRADSVSLPVLVWGLREAASNANSDDHGVCGHGIGFLFALAESTL